MANQGLQTLIKALTDAMMAGRMPGVPLTNPGPLYRMGPPQRFKVTPDSAPWEQPVTVPEGATVFQFTNPNPFSVRLRGSRAGQTFQPVDLTEDPNTEHFARWVGDPGWLWLPGTQGIRTSLNPALISCCSVDGPFASIDDRQKAGEGWIELQYGTGY